MDNRLSKIFWTSVLVSAAAFLIVEAKLDQTARSVEATKGGDEKRARFLGIGDGSFAFGISKFNSGGFPFSVGLYGHGHGHYNHNHHHGFGGYGGLGYGGYGGYNPYHQQNNLIGGGYYGGSYGFKHHYQQHHSFGYPGYHPGAFGGGGYAFH